MNLNTPKPKLVLLDPALREFGGHHPGLITTLTKTKAITENKFTLLVYANKNCSTALIEELSVDNSIVVKKYFKTDFYQHFYSKERINTFNSYIQELVNEYYGVFKKHNACVTTFYYHTLNWEHAYALGLAIGLFNNKHALQHKHIVSLMYSPCKFDINNTVIDNSNANNVHSTIDKDRLFKFSLGFRLLSKQKNVVFFATEYELTAHYQSILEQKIDWCPCGLISDSHLNDINNRDKNNQNSPDNQHNNALLYLGDAKINKGFLALPSMLTNLIANSDDKNITFTIQYTLTNNNESLANVHQQLQQMSKEQSRIIIINNFLNDNEMHQLLLQTNHIVFNYDKLDYANQSSGVLWLAAAYKMHIYLLTNTWLNREAKRLSCNYYTPCNIKKLVDDINTSTGKKHAININYSRLDFQRIHAIDIQWSRLNLERIELYQSRLFSDIGNWLNETLISKDNAKWKI